VRSALEHDCRRTFIPGLSPRLRELPGDRHGDSGLPEDEEGEQRFLKSERCRNFRIEQRARQRAGEHRKDHRFEVAEGGAKAVLAQTS
jgi:hypothetical protein